jgi:hypothetical protein
MHPDLMYAHAQALISERLRAAARHTPPASVQDVSCPVSGRLWLHRLLHTLSANQHGWRTTVSRAARAGFLNGRARSAGSE